VTQAASHDGRPVGVLAVNLGSPESPTPRALRAYLREFLSDPRVVDWPRPVWIPLLRGLVLPVRAARLAAAYESVWTDEGSPLVATFRRQTLALQDHLGQGWVVAGAMRYGAPSLKRGIVRLLQAGVRRIVLLPLFPQRSEATTGSVVAAAQAELAELDQDVELRVIPHFPTDEGYLEANVATVRDSLSAHPDTEHIVFSFHGLPIRRAEQEGELYREQCESTALALALRLSLTEEDWSLVYQSRFGPESWLQPDAHEFVPGLASRKKKVLVTCPGFTADCLETLHEIGDDLAAAFRAAGGQELVVTPCLNARPEWIRAMADLVRREASL
jgi:ferrochelatase